MKNFILGLALASLSVACTSEQKASVNDPSTPAAMEAECSTESCEKACCMEKAAGECSSTKAAGECSSVKKVCPVSGKELN
jgi:hypothetical protein